MTTSGPGSGRQFQSVSTPSARQIDEQVTGHKLERLADLLDPVPGQQAGGEQLRRQAEVALLDRILRRRRRHVGLPLLEVRRLLPVFFDHGLEYRHIGR